MREFLICWGATAAIYITAFLLSKVITYFDSLSYKKALREREMREFKRIRQDVFLSPRMLTKDEYRIIKAGDWLNQHDFWIMHLTEAGYNMYSRASSEGQRGKYHHYCRIWEIVQTPLFKAMKE